MSDRLPCIPGYDVEAEIGRGGMGVVYRVRQQSSGSIRALKMILNGRGAAFPELARFRIEAEALACLNHPNIVKIRDVGMYAGYPYISIDFAERGSLKQLIAQRPQRPMWAADLVRTLAMAMQHAHERGMLHRDLKPANVLVMGDGTPIVTDFGLVKFTNPFREVSKTWCTVGGMTAFMNEELNRYASELAAQYSSSPEPSAGSDNLTRDAWEQCAARTGILGNGTRLQSVKEFLSEAQKQSEQNVPNLDGLTPAGAVMGSPNYMAPEQAVGDLAQIGPRTDVYALGGILYELLTGQPPFRAQSLSNLLSKACAEAPAPPRQLVPDVSGDLEAVCLKCLEKSPESRYQTAAALAEDLTRFIDGYTPCGAVSAVAGPRPAASGSAVEWPSTAAPGAETPQHRATTTRSWWPFGRK